LRNTGSKIKSEVLENIIVLKYIGVIDHWKGYFIIPEMSIKWAVLVRAEVMPLFLR
jgi:hypothetical protein